MEVRRRQEAADDRVQRFEQLGQRPRGLRRLEDAMEGGLEVAPLPALGDVLNGAMERDGVAFGIPLQLAAADHVPDRTAGADDAEVDLLRLPGAQAALHRRIEGLPVVGMDQPPVGVEGRRCAAGVDPEDAAHLLRPLELAVGGNEPPAPDPGDTLGLEELRAAPAQVLLRSDPVGDVADRRHVHRALVPIEVRGRDLDREHRAVPLAVPAQRYPGDPLGRGSPRPVGLRGDVGMVHAEPLLSRVTVQRRRGGVDLEDMPGFVVHEDDRVGLQLEQATVALLALPQRLQGRRVLTANPAVLDRSLDRGPEAGHAVLQDVVVGARGQDRHRLGVVQGAGHDQERRPRRETVRDLQSLHPVERRQRVVAEDHLGPEAFEGCDERLPRLDPAGIKADPTAAQFALGQLRRRRLILDDHHAQ